MTYTMSSPTTTATNADYTSTATNTTVPSSPHIAAATAATGSHHPKKARSTKPKLFQCTGFGDCQMVFTRSEHLARHTRKHTGEKPYLCIVPGCTRRFSRFDNMMQHTQTHKTSRFKRQVITHEQTYHSSNSTPTTTSAPYMSSPLSSASSVTTKYELEPSPEFYTISSDEESNSSYGCNKMAVNQLCGGDADTQQHPQQQKQLQPILPPNYASSQPQQTPLKELHLTQAEFEALQGFGRFRHTPIFIDSFRDLATAVYIDP